jgi:GTP cyclohydrolase II
MQQIVQVESALYSLPVVEMIAEARLPTEAGEFRIVGFRDCETGLECVALIKGELDSAEPCLVRIHSQCLTGDVFASTKCDCGRQLREAVKLIHQAGRGVIVYEQQEGRGIGLLNKIRAYALQDQGLDTVEANLQLGFAADERTYIHCAAVLKMLGLENIHLLSNNPHKIAALRNAGLKVVKRVPLQVAPSADSTEYLRVKREKLGHYYRHQP